MGWFNTWIITVAGSMNVIMNGNESFKCAKKKNPKTPLLVTLDLLMKGSSNFLEHKIILLEGLVN